MFQGTISTVSLQRTLRPTVPGVRYTIYVFDEALAIAPLDPFARTRWMAEQIPVAGALIGWISDAFAKDSEAEVEHKIEELPPDITVEELGQRTEHAHAVPMAQIAQLLITPRFWLGKPYLRARFVSRDVDHYAYKRLWRQRQTVVSDPEAAKALLEAALGDRIAHEWRTWAKGGRLGRLLGRRG